MRDSPVPKHTQAYSIAWIAPYEHERVTAQMMLDTWQSIPKDFEQHPNDKNSYTWGHMAGHDVVIASLSTSSRHKTGSGAHIARGLRLSLPQTRVALLVGTGAGVPDNAQKADVLLGDLVIGSPEGGPDGVVQYNAFYKAHQEGESDKHEKIEFLDRPPQPILNAVSALHAKHKTEDLQITEHLQTFKASRTQNILHKYPGADHDVLRHDGLKNRDSPKMHWGTIASGSEIIEHHTKRDQMLILLKKAAKIKPICFETEAAGLRHDFPCFIVRGICDYGDERKDDRWQRYAAAIASAFAKELLDVVKHEEVLAAAPLGQLFPENW